MFGIGSTELIVIAVVALIAIGPKELPGVLRAIGLWSAKIRRMANEFQDQFREAMREAEMEELKKKVEDVTSSTTDLSNFDPMASVRKDVETALGDPPNLDVTPPEPAKVSDAAEPPVETPAPEAATIARKAGEGA